MTTRTTLRHVATAAGVSIRTASEILNGKDGAYREETRLRVRAEAERLAYRPNAYARRMQSGRFRAIALLSPDGHAYEHVSEAALLGLASRCAEGGLNLIVSLFAPARLADPAGLPQVLRELTVDGVVINWRDAPPAGLVQGIGIPAVWFNHDLPADAVRPDDEAAAAAAVQRLLAAGHRRIGYLDYPYLSLARRHASRDLRLRGYTTALHAVGLQPHMLSLPPGTDVSEDARRAFTAAWLSRPDRPTAVLSARPNDALMALTMALGKGLVPARDLSLICFGEGLAKAGYAIETIVPLTAALGSAAADLLVQRLGHPAPLPSRLVPCAILPGECVGPCPDG